MSKLFDVSKNTGHEKINKIIAPVISNPETKFDIHPKMQRLIIIYQQK